MIEKTINGFRSLGLITEAYQKNLVQFFANISPNESEISKQAFSSSKNNLYKIGDLKSYFSKRYTEQERLVLIKLLTEEALKCHNETLILQVIIWMLLSDKYVNY